MAETIAGTCRKRPQLNIPIELLDLDGENPRLAKENQGSSQLELIRALYEEFDIEELAYSMAENGYFDEEPIVVIPQTIKDLKLPLDVDEQQKALQKLIAEKKIRFTVVEGNRRTATLKLLIDNSLRRQIKVNTDFPKNISEEVKKDLSIIPGIFYPNRNGISAYLGVRHIAGLLKWEAYAKAIFLANRIEEGIRNKKTIEESIKEVQRQTADRTDVIKKQYLCYKVLKEAEDDLDFDIANVKERFSLITLALNSPSIRDFIGIRSHKDSDFSKRIVPKKQLPNLELLLTWIYGNGKDKQPLLTDSRKITSRLAPILADDDAREYLIKYEALEEAYERSGGEKKFLVKKLNDAIKNLKNALSIAYKYKESDIEMLVSDCIDVSEQLKKMIS